MSVAAEKLNCLRTVITENLRVQRDGESIDYINIGNALQELVPDKTEVVPFSGTAWRLS